LSRGREGEAGFTLVEILIATIVLAVGILSAAQLVASSDASTLDSELQQIATEQGEKALEDTRAVGYNSIGYGTNGTPGGATYQAPDATGPEDLVTLSSGAGIVPTRTFSVARGGGKPPVTGTIKTYLTWRDEECTPLNTNSITALTTLSTKLTALKNQLTPLLGSTGLMQRTYNDLTGDGGRLIQAIPNGQRPKYIEVRDALSVLLPLLNSTQTYTDNLLTQLTALAGQTIDVCDVSLANLAGLKSLLELDQTSISDLTTRLASVQTPLTNLVGTVAVPGPLDILFGYVEGTLGQATCGLLPTPNICGTVTSLTNQVDLVSAPVPSTLATTLNNKISGITVDASGLTTNTTHNTKRITVAVTVDTNRADVTPKNTLYMSTVATEPDAGFFINPG
jgi:prepilin-type N-terminal cleavage/methylation domain-containing protein